MIDVLKIFGVLVCLAAFLIFAITFMGRNLVWSLKEVVDYYLARRREMILELEKELGDGTARELN